MNLEKNMVSLNKVLMIILMVSAVVLNVRIKDSTIYIILYVEDYQKWDMLCFIQIIS